jgi:hypothetical protein
MILPMKTMTDYLLDIGVGEVAHTEKTYLAHAIGTYRDMKEWQASDELCRAAMFHSIYGTEGFQDFTLPLERRDELRQLIGDHAELIAYANCAMDRASFYALVDQELDEYQIVDRIVGGCIHLSAAEFEDLMRVHLCDFLEQVERAEVWDYERQTMKTMSERLGGVERQSYDAVFVREPQNH